MSCCTGNTVLIFPCSGGANTGKASDMVARKLTKDKVGLISCLASIGAGVSGFIESAKGATYNIVIDGCPLSCAKKIMDKNNITNYKHIIVTELGIKKGETKITDEVIEELVEKIKEKVKD